MQQKKPTQQNYTTLLEKKQKNLWAFKKLREMLMYTTHQMKIDTEYFAYVLLSGIFFFFNCNSITSMFPPAAWDTIYS